jgi:hypothetical protein
VSWFLSSPDLIGLAVVASLALGCKEPVRGACTWSAINKAGAPIEICRGSTAKDCAPVPGDPSPPTFLPGGDCRRLGYVCEPGDIGFPPPETAWRRLADGGCPAGSAPP